jgi:hypothetical protein
MSGTSTLHLQWSWLDLSSARAGHMYEVMYTQEVI